MSGHTPGPWTLTNGGYIHAKPTAEHLAKFPKNKRVSVGHVVTFAECTDEQATANARLIAAAPDLLAALRALIDDSWSNISGQLCVPSKATVNAARAALAKAGAA